jgi:eukaryotic-like serine/threonine-protein kinase
VTVPTIATEAFVYTRAVFIGRDFVAAKLARFSWLPGGLAATLVIAAGRLLAPDSVTELETGMYDRVVRAAADQPSSEVVIVGIDAQSVSKLGAWPWPRDVHASLLDRLTQSGAKVVTFLEPFDTPQSGSELERIRAALALLDSSDLRDSPQAAQLRALLGASRSRQDPNIRLSQSMAAHGNVVLPAPIQPTGTTTDGVEASLPHAPSSVSVRIQRASAFRITQPIPEELLAAASGIGHMYLPTERDGILRSDLAFARVASTALPSLALVTVTRALDIQAKDLRVGNDHALVLGNRVIPLDEQARVRPEYLHPNTAPSFQRFAYWQVLAGEVDDAVFKDKIVLIGLTESDLGAAAPIATPASAHTTPVFALASTVSSYLEGTTYSTPLFASIVEWVAAGVAILFAAFLLPAAGAVMGALATVLFVALLAVTEIGLLTSTNAWARMMLPALAACAGFGLYIMGELIRRANVKSDGGKDSATHLRSLGQTFQKQGQLDLAFETFRRCPLDATTMDLLYHLGMDFERRRQLQKASSVYTYMASRDPNYGDLWARRARVQEDPVVRPATRAPAMQPAPAPTIAVEDHEPDFFAKTMPAASGRTLGRYEIERELGKGAMGTVYLGRDPKINRVVAIKAIPLADEFEEQDLAEARARFFREAEMAGRLNHPAIVTVYDAGEDHGLAYIAMEYLRGQHLSHFVDSTRLLPPKSVMLLVARVAEALHYAHRQNVVHRDIKPANIMFNPDTDELKITDFGIARLTDTSRTKTGIVLGTPSFMSPEQLEGRPLDGRSDQFDLGVSLYQLLCGQLPFRAESMPRLMQKIATEPHASVRLIRPELPECIDAIIDRTLAKDADARYATCGEMGWALRNCADAEDVKRAAEPKHEWLTP